MTERHIGLVPLAAGLSAALVTIYVLCALIAVVLPGSPASHAWLALFGVDQSLTIASVLTGIVANIVSAWIAASVFASVYNAMIER